MNKVVWFDVSEIKDWNGHFTGIQRVVFSLGRELALDKTLNLKFCRYDRRRDVFVETDYSFIEPEYTRQDGSKKNPAPYGIIPHLRHRAGVILPKSIKVFLKSVLSFNAYPFVSFQKPIIFSKKDTLIIPGAFWTGPLRPILPIKKKERPHVVGFMYDMVPVIMPQFCTVATVLDFKKEIKIASRVIDQWIAISENTMADLLNYSMKNRMNIKRESISVIRLGSDINVKGSIKSPFIGVKKPENFILFVSTIEARKNQQLVYQLIKRAAERSLTLPTIVLAGKHGWHSDDFISILLKDIDLNGKIIWLKEVDDRGLRWLYKNCLFTIYPSLYEGWGLPVAESIAYKKLSVASRSSSIPEIAGNLVDYFSPYSVDEFLEKVYKYASDKEALDKKVLELRSFHQTSWADTAAQLKQALNS